MNESLQVISPLAGYLESFIGEDSFLMIVLATAFSSLVLVTPLLLIIAYISRKLAADAQIRIGPNRIGYAGIFQVCADILKLFFKEERSAHVDHLLLKLFPVLGVVVIFMGLAHIPFAQHWILVDIDSSLLSVLATVLLSSILFFVSSYASDNTWSILTAYRTVTHISAYLLPMVLSFITPVLITGSTNLLKILKQQEGMPWKWLVMHDPGSMLSFVVLFFSILIWQGIAPANILRTSAGSEDGMSKAFSSISYGFVLIQEQLLLLLGSAVIVTVYFGGAQSPFELDFFGRAASLIEWGIFSLKVLTVCICITWIRWSFIRFSTDQLIKISWRILIPLGLAGVLLNLLWSVLVGSQGMGDFL